MGTGKIQSLVTEIEALSEADIKRHVAKRLPRYMVPARVEVLTGLPRTSTGKVDRQALSRTAGASVS